MFKKTFLLIIIFSFISCSDKQFSLENYKNYPVKFAKKNVVYPKNEFEIVLPINWDWKIEDYEDTNEVILGIDAFSKPNNENFYNGISIQKMKPFSSDNSLKSEFDTVLKKSQENQSWKLIDSGKTDILKTEAYYIHLKSKTEKQGGLEMLTIITISNNDDNYYHINGLSPITKDLKLNMATIISCLKTFKQN